MKLFSNQSVSIRFSRVARTSDHSDSAGLQELLTIRGKLEAEKLGDSGRNCKNQHQDHEAEEISLETIIRLDFFL